MDKASKRYDDAAAALSALLDVKLQPGDPISQTLLTACNRWDATIGAHLSPGDTVQQSMKEARQKFTAAGSALSLARDLVQILTGPDPYSRHGVKIDPVSAAAAFQLAIDSGHADEAPAAAFNLGVLREEQGDPAGAVAAYQLAIDSGHADQGPKSAYNLGLLRASPSGLAGVAQRCPPTASATGTVGTTGHVDLLTLPDFMDMGVRV